MLVLFYLLSNAFHCCSFLVGTEEGRIHKCSLDYAASYLATYGTDGSSGHQMAVYSLKWNQFHPRVFLSASADWTVRMWDESYTSAPIMTFDLGTAVGDCAWAPYSSTVFACVTDEGKVNVYDLHSNKHEQLCEQKVVKKAKCTKVAFSTKAALLLVGDSNGGVISLKLSPNLRRITPIPQMGGGKKNEGSSDAPTREEVEIRKMDRLLALSDAKITTVTPIPGKGGKKGAAKGAGAGASGAAPAAGGAEGGGDAAAAAAPAAAE
jgi:dynein intermediate chain 1, axonemal